MHKFWLKHPSTYVALAAWGATGFMAQPTFASLIVHIVVTPVLLVGVIWLARHEGRNA